MGLEEFPGQTPEAALFNDVSNRDLVIEFLRSSLNPETTDLVAGRELTRRLHEHAGYKGKLATEPLTLPDGRPVLGEGGQPLMRIDYLNWALKDHPWAMGK